MCFSSCVDRQPHPGLQTAGASQFLSLTDEEGRHFTREAWKRKKENRLKIILTAPHSRLCGCGSAAVPEIGGISIFDSLQMACFHLIVLTGDGRNTQSNVAPRWDFPKATQISLAHSAEWKRGWLVICYGDQLSLLSSVSSVRTACSCQFPLNKTQITVCKLLKPCSWILFVFKKTR